MATLEVKIVPNCEKVESKSAAVMDLSSPLMKILLSVDRSLIFFFPGDSDGVE